MSRELERTRTLVAAEVHELWGHWMAYLFTTGQENSDGTYTLPADQVIRWRRQMATDYAGLTKREQASDLEHVDRLIRAVCGGFPLICRPITRSLGRSNGQAGGRSR
jgi:hypothetical protein